MTTTGSRLRVGAALFMAVLLSVTGCSNDDEDAASASTTTADGAAASEDSAGSDDAADLENPGDDLLAAERWGGKSPGDTLEGSWRFPESYEPTGNMPNNMAKILDGDTDYSLGVGSTAGRENFAESAAALEEGAAEEGQETGLEEVTVAGKDYVLVTQEDDGTSRRTLFHDPGEGEFYYTFQFAAETTLAETPPEQLRGYYQMVASFELKPA